MSNISNEQTTLSELMEQDELPIGNENAEVPEPTISKSQKKKLAKRQLWESTKKERRQAEKLKRKQKIQKAKEEGIPLGPNRKNIKKNKMIDSSCKIRVAVDMSMHNLMSEREFSKAIKQVSRCYSINRRAAAPLQFYLTSFNGIVKDKMMVTGAHNWDINIRESSHLDAFDKKDIVYLTSDSEHEVNELDSSKVYIIGGLVDHNHNKGYCYKMAVKNGIAHAKLPLDKHLIMNSRKVLTIDHVFNIMLKVGAGLSWTDALLQVIPKRKGAKGVEDSDNDEAGEEDEDSDNNEAGEEVKDSS